MSLVKLGWCVGQVEARIAWGGVGWRWVTWGGLRWCGGEEVSPMPTPLRTGSVPFSDERCEEKLLSLQPATRGASSGAASKLGHRLKLPWLPAGLDRGQIGWGLPTAYCLLPTACYTYLLPATYFLLTLWATLGLGLEVAQSCAGWRRRTLPVASPTRDFGYLLHLDRLSETYHLGY